MPKGNRADNPGPLFFCRPGARGFSRNALLCISTAYGSPSGHCLPFSSSLFLPIQNLMCSAFMYGYLLQCSFRLSVFLLFHAFPGNFHGIGYMQTLRKVHGLNIHNHPVPAGSLLSFVYYWFSFCSPDFPIYWKTRDACPALSDCGLIGDMEPCGRPFSIMICLYRK